ncbi:MAG TPA: hypothetical protein VE135_08380 [Pyrinomonadaceae bacterium]|nr:hypothetical protein [Pyrinomonadaceae bacterium]
MPTPEKSPEKVTLSDEERRTVKGLLESSNKQMEQLAQVVIKNLRFKGKVKEIRAYVEHASPQTIVKICFFMSDGTCGCVTENSCEPC